MGLADIFKSKPDEKAPDKAEKATNLLKKDHEIVRGLFKEMRAAEEGDGDSREKRRIFGEIDRELSIHAKVEEEIFYPNVRRVDGEESTKLVLEAQEEHAIVKTLLQQIRALEAGDETFSAKVKVLMESVEHHADEEEDDMFPEAEELGNERLEALGAQIAARKEELKSGKTGVEEGGPRSSKTGKGSKAAASTDSRSTGARKAASTASRTRGGSTSRAGSSSGAKKGERGGSSRSTKGSSGSGSPGGRKSSSKTR